MPKYKIHMTYLDGHKEHREIRGYPIYLPELTDIKLFIHRPYPLSAGENRWNISEMKTGLALIAHCQGTKKQAIEALKSKLATIKTDNISERLKRMIDKHIKEFGVANKEKGNG